ncbi:hypothetical protein [Ornithinibacillus contaminans]|uniref:hypothetical protein n=1 Tax=Ornithinibacillus contaminans TaxID=694055 RepID=UPI00064D7B4B|nr:hypothetical protein [Ornithinibacillus contaminans]
MKKLILSSVVIFFSLIPFATNAQPSIGCPNAKELEKPSRADKNELVEALDKIIPETYGESDYGNFYSEWEVVSAKPLSKTNGIDQDEDYYDMARNFCGEVIADQSWLVTLHFPRWEGKSESAVNGQIFLAKNKAEDNWFAWYRYH